jgi:hypothetical protein
LLAAPLAVALEPDEVLPEDDEILDHAPGNVRNDLPQRSIGRGGNGLVGDLPVGGAIRIGKEDQAIAEVRHHILLPRLALGDRLRRAGRIGEIDQLDVGGREVAGLDHQETVGKRKPQRDGEALRHLLIDELVLGRRGPEPMAEDLLPPLAGIATHVEQPLAVLRPHRPAAHLGDGIGKILPGRQVANLERVALGAIRVDRVGQELVVRADGRFRH